MIKKNNVTILLLSPFIYPEPISTARYNTYLVKALVGQGCSVEIIALHPVYPAWKPKLTNAVLEGVKIYRGGGLSPYPKSMVLRRIHLELRFTFHVVRQFLFKRNKDFVIPIFPPIIFFFFIRLLLPKGTKKIGIVHDLLTVMAQFSGSSPPKKILMKIVRLFEKRIFSSCEKLIFVSKSMASRAMNEYGLNPNKVSVCYPFVNLEKGDANNALGHFFASGYKHIVYSGAIGEKQNPYTLLKLFQAIVQKRADVCCHFFSRGPLFDALRKANAQIFERILFHDLVPEENLYELYLRSDIQIIPQKKGSSEGAIPSKLPNVISAGVPIFAISDPGSELSEIIRESGIGYGANSWNIDKLAVELNNFLEKSHSQPHQERQRMVSDFLEHNFSIDQLVHAILE